MRAAATTTGATANRPGLRDVGHQHGERTPSEGESEVRVDEPSEQLQVVREDQERAEHEERDQGPSDPRQSEDPEGNRAGQAHDGDRHQRRGGNTGAEGASVELVERVRGEPHGEQEREQGTHQAGHADHWRQAGADDHIGQVPCRVGGMKESPPVAPSPGSSGVEGGPFAPGLRLGRR